MDTLYRLVKIGNPSDFPVLRDRSIKIQPGLEHSVKLSGYSVTTEAAARAIAPEKRNCYFPDEASLDFYSTYSFTNCKFECKLKLSLTAIGCTPWYLPQVGGPMCDPWNASQFNEIMKKDLESCDHCLADCISTIYSTSKSSAPFR